MSRVWREKRWHAGALLSPPSRCLDRIALIESLSVESTHFPETRFAWDGETLVQQQQKIAGGDWRVMATAARVAALRGLAADLDRAEAAGFVHGDICWKDVLWDGQQLWLIDLEPDLRQHRNGVDAWMVTVPWVAHADLKADQVTSLTDRIGFAAVCKRALLGLPEDMSYRAMYQRRKQEDAPLPWGICDAAVIGKSFQELARAFTPA